jgi:starch synthase (maltosyl-transferring)
VGVARQPSRLNIEDLSPSLSAGRYPVKRIVGALVEVSANIFKEGHEQLAARILYRPANERRWRQAPLFYEYNPDRWFGRFRADQLGRWQYTVEAWTDHFGTWRRDLNSRLEVGQNVSLELLEGALLLEQAARRLKGETAERILGAARQLADTQKSLDFRLAAAFSEDILHTVSAPLLEEEVTRYTPVHELVVDRERAGFAAWYELFPRSQSQRRSVHGTFADVIRRLPELAALGFDVVYLPPIHPIGHSHRKGKNNATVCEPGDVGSPWAIGSELGGHTAIHPELGTLEDFRHLVRTAGDLGLEIALDYALQFSPDHPWTKEHPEWFFIRPDGSIRHAENPPKKYEDIVPPNLWCSERKALWNACKDVFEFWIEQGVRTFRVDNPHTKPFPFWEWIIREVQRDHPDVIFLSEAFTRPIRMRALAKLGFTQSYSYFTWKNHKRELREYLTELTTTEMSEYYRPNFFTNTPDILHEYLQRGGRPAFRIRLLLAATLSPVYGIYSGFELCENQPRHPGSEEYLDSEKYEIRTRNWDAPGNIKHDIARLNRIRRENPALHSFSNLTFLETNNHEVLAYRKVSPGNQLMVVVNLDPHRRHDAHLHLPLSELGLSEDEAFDVEDLLSGERYRWRGATNFVRLDPSERVGHLFRLAHPR